MISNKGYALKLAAFVIAFILIGYGYYGFFYIPQNTGFGGPKCIIEGIQSQQTFSTGAPCKYSLEALGVGVLVLILTIVIWWKYH